MGSKRELPGALAAQAASRTDASVRAIETVVEEIRRERAAGGHVPAEPLTLRAVMARAGLNHRFLYGERHKLTTKPRIEAFVEQMNAAAREVAQSSTPLDAARDEAKEWQERYEKALRHAHLWAHRVRALQRRVRELETDGRPEDRSEGGPR